METKQSREIWALWCQNPEDSIQGFGLRVARSLLTGLLFLDISKLSAFTFLGKIYEEFGPPHLERLSYGNLYGLFCRMDIQENSIWHLREFIINPSRLMQLIANNPFPPQLPLEWIAQENEWVPTIQIRGSLN